MREKNIKVISSLFMAAMAFVFVSGEGRANGEASSSRKGPSKKQEGGGHSQEGSGAERAKNKTTSTPPSHGSSKESAGPTYFLEAIRVKGNHKTSTEVIKRHLPFKIGDAICGCDPKVNTASYRLLGLGYFRSVNLYLKKGSKRGYAILVVEVKERGTFWINSIFLGASEVTPFWGGIDVADNNFLGKGIVLSGAFVAGVPSKVSGSHLQHAERLRFSERYFLGSPFELSLMILYSDASEFFRIDGKNSWSGAENFKSVRYYRYGGTLGTAVDIGRWNRMGAHIRLEGVDAELPLGLVRNYPDGSTSGVNYYLDPGKSLLSSLVFSFTRDKRNEAILPTKGYRLDVTGELASEIFGSSYSFTKVVGRYRHWWSLPRLKHSLSLEFLGGLIVGNAPLFSKFFISDLNSLLPQRALDLNFSTLPSLNLFNTVVDSMRYEDVAAKIALEYSVTLFQKKSVIYRGNLFIRIGAFALFSREHLRQRESTLREAIPVDFTLDAGVRFDTHVGVFTISIANALGRIPIK